MTAPSLLKQKQPGLVDITRAKNKSAQGHHLNCKGQNYNMEMSRLEARVDDTSVFDLKSAKYSYDTLLAR